MKTKDFIKMLQEADPKGEGFIRLGDGIPTFAEAKEGYWDGPYTYLDENGNYVKSTQNYKVDIHTTDLYDFVWDHTQRTTSWEEVKDKIKFELTYVDNSDKINSTLDYAENAYKDAIACKESSFQKQLEDAIKHANKGWEWFQDKRVDTHEYPKDGPNMHKYYTWKIYDEYGKEQGSNVWNTQPVLESDRWERRDHGSKYDGAEYYHWVKK